MNFKPSTPLLDGATALSAHPELDSRAEGSFQSTACPASSERAASAGRAAPAPVKPSQRGMRRSDCSKRSWLIVHSAHCRAAVNSGAALPIALQLHLNQRDDAMKLDLPLARIAQAGIACLAPCSSRAEGSFQSTAYPASNELAASPGGHASTPGESEQHSTRPAVFSKRGWLIVHSAHCCAGAKPGAALPIALQLHLNQRDDAMKLDLPLDRTCWAPIAPLAPCSSSTDGANALHGDLAPIASAEVSHG